MSKGPRHPRLRRLTSAAAVVTALTLAAAACGDTTAPTKSDASSPTAIDASSTVVTIDTFAFGPKVVEVNVGDTVTWTNKDNILHTVTSGDRDYEPGNSGLVTATRKDGMFDQKLDGRGATAQFTFTKAGSFHYFCDLHPGMEADVMVS